MPSVIPTPTRLEPREGRFSLDGPVRVVAPDAVAAAGSLVRDALARVGAADAEIVAHDDGSPGAIVLSLGDATLQSPDEEPRPDGASAVEPVTEGYSLAVDAARVVIVAAHPTGLVRALATLEQLVEDGEDGPGIGAVTISDAPRYRWRGLMIDIARHFFGVDVLRDVVDLAALYKLDVLHLHLSDDQGWRLDLASRPELVERSGATEVGGGAGGFLSREDYAGLVEYAGARGVVVVPEIDLPGHTNAALHAVPELNPSGAAAAPYTGTEVGFSALDLELPATEPFLRDVLGEVAALTPGDVVHIGGDEVKTVTPEAYARFVEVAAGIVAAHGKRVAVWQEAGKAALPDSSLVQLWDSNASPDPVIEAAARGARVVLSPANRVYLDMRYDESYPLGLAWAGTVDVRDAYDWDPATATPGLDASAVEGVEAALWTETISTRDELFAMLLPRLAAVAEAGWSEQEARDADAFLGRLATHARLWEARGWAYHRSEQVPWVSR